MAGLPIKIKGNVLLMSTVIFLFSGLRFNIGWDFENYYDLLKYPYGHNFMRIEYLPRKLISFSHDLQFLQLFFIVTSFFVMYFVYKGVILRSILPKLSILAFVCLPLFFFQSLTIIRQILAVSIVFYGTLYFLQEKKYIYFFSLIIFSSLIHISSIFALLFIPIFKLKLSRKLQSLLLLGSFITSPIITYFLLNLPILPFGLSGLIAFYTSKNDFSGFGLIIYLMIGLAFINIFFYKKLLQINDHNEFYVKLFTTGIIIYNSLLPFGIGGARLSIYFLIYIILVVPSYVYLLKGERIQTVLKDFILLTLCLVFFTNIYISTSAYTRGLTSKDPLLPYRFYFQD